MSGDNFIRSYAARMAKSAENEQKILMFLRDELYTTAQVLAKLLKFASVSPVYAILNRMCRAGLLAAEKFDTDGLRPFKLYGITSHGAVMVKTNKDDPLRVRTFQPSKVNLNTLRHRLDTQFLRILAEAQGMQWKPSHNITLTKGQKAPDALMRTPEKQIFAIEVERVAKSPQRYREIMEIYLKQLPENGWHGVIYLFPDENLKRRIARIFHAITDINVNGQRFTLSPAQRERTFQFITYKDF